MRITNFEEATNYIFKLNKTYWRILKKLSPGIYAYIYCDEFGKKSNEYSYPSQGYYVWVASEDLMNQCIHTKYDPSISPITPVQKKIRLMEQRFKTRHV